MYCCTQNRTCHFVQVTAIKPLWHNLAVLKVVNRYIWWSTHGRVGHAAAHWVRGWAICWWVSPREAGPRSRDRQRGLALHHLVSTVHHEVHLGPPPSVLYSMPATELGACSAAILPYPHHCFFSAELIGWLPRRAAGWGEAQPWSGGAPFLGCPPLLAEYRRHAHPSLIMY